MTRTRGARPAPRPDRSLLAGVPPAASLTAAPRPTPRPRRRLTLRPALAMLAASTVLFWGLGAGIEQAAHSQAPVPSPTFTAGSVANGHALYPTPANGLIYFAVMGSDVRRGAPGAGGGCDAIHIVVLNPGTMHGTIINVPRDTYLQGHKITDICRANGFAQGLAVLRSYTGIPVQYFADTNFNQFVQVIDEIGGLDVHVYTRLYNPADTGANFNPGDYHMLGGDLLAFARERDSAPGGDFGRTTDQAQIILSGFNHFGSAGSDLSYLLALIKYGRQHVQFNVPLPTLIQWGLIARQLKPADLQSCTLLGNGQMIGGADVEIPAASNQAIFGQVVKDGTLPPGAQCFMGVNWEIPPNE
ncbi:MAG TPA: LCP family protein [Actinomycetota bacterium]|nr:LCP family protein [Actinomycetota bacterium]